MANHAALIRQENAGLDVVGRGRHFVEFALPDGKRRHVATIDPLHKRDSETEIDATWYPDSGAWQWRIGENDWQAHARSVFNVGSLIEWRHSSGEWVIVDPQSINWINQDNSRQQIAIKQAVTGTASDATLTFENAYGAGRHFEYIAHPRRLIKHFVLDQALPDPAAWLTGALWFEVEWTITNSAGVELYLDGARWKRKNKVKVQTANAIEFRSLATGEVLWYADAPIATDSTAAENGGPQRSACQYEVAAQGGSYFIRVRVPREWMLSAVYPVIIDPTFTDGYGGDVQTYKDTRIKENSANTNYGTDINIEVSDYGVGDTSNVLIEFDVSSIPAGSTIDSATLSIYNPLLVGSFTMAIYRLLVSWTEAGATWNSRNGTNNWSTAGAQGSGTDHAESATQSGVAASASSSWTNFTVTDDVQAFVDGTTNYGWVIDPDSAPSSDYALYWSSDYVDNTALRPKLVVEYTEAGGAPYTLDADAGAYTLTGQAAGLLASRVLALDTGEYALTGQAAGLLAARALAADAGEYALTGHDQALTAARLIALDTGEYTTTGQDPALTIARLLGLDAGEYALTGTDPTLIAARLLALDAGEYALTGNDAGLLAARLLTLDAGGYTLTGQDATLTYTPAGAYTLDLDAGAYTLTGHAVELLISRVLSADAGVYALTGADADVLRGFALAADAGAYAVTGNAAGLALARVLGLDAGAYALTGRDVTLVYSGGVTPTPDSRIYVVAADGRVYIVALEERVHTIAAESRTHTVTAA